MIAEHITMKSAAKSSIGRLVDYLTDKQNKQSRVAEMWARNCVAAIAGEDLITGDETEIADEINDIAQEMEMTQLQNSRAKDDKTYHLVISFPPGEEPTLDHLQEIERSYCASLGFAEHQRLAVVHRDTDCLHLHLAINKIHPKKLTINTPVKDYYKLMKTSAELEKSLGFTQTNHEARPGNPAITASENKIAKAEHFGAETLATWIKTNCAEKIAAATTWDELHRVCAENGLTAKLHGNGLVFQETNADKGIAVKASTISREFSKAKFEKKLGAFIAPATIDNSLPTTDSPLQADSPQVAPVARAEKEVDAKEKTPQRYTKTPPNAGLFAQYQQTFAAAKTAYAAAKEELDAFRADEIRQINEKYQRERGQTNRLLNRRLRTVALQTEITEYRAELREKYHVGGYLEWLQNQARNGNEDALQALRKRAFALVKRANFVRGEREEIDRKIKNTQDKIELLQKDGDKESAKWELKRLNEQLDDLRQKENELNMRRNIETFERQIASGILAKSATENLQKEVARLREELAKIDTVTKQGTLIYCVGDEVIRDRRDEFFATQDISQNNAIMFLKMAQSRFGDRLNITGDEEFKDKMVAAAVAGKLNITFKDEALEEKRRQLLNAPATLNSLAKVLETGKSITVKNDAIGEIFIDAGKTGKGGFGLKHIIEGRHTKDGLSENDITALLYLVTDAAKNGKMNKELVKSDGKYGFEKNGVIAIVSKTRNGVDERFVITGYGIRDKQEELTDAIRTVSAQYDYTPEFSGFRNQVGAVISSLGNVSHESSIVKENAIQQTPKEKADEKLPEKSRGNDFSR
ncbi:hypothetical protein FACS1894139_04420 [Planctomycetales bacterium]|nr:hypothetical protein FACS1894107_02080 [Planctomycetales bacterium]GHT01267.1 hypothetical protein FACS1894108_14800 [Planctomycetales bacterium]GHT03646.1 hypothetical protein FACS1894139_04420 [Planctomycetales bacterium]